MGDIAYETMEDYRRRIRDLENELMEDMKTETELNKKIKNLKKKLILYGNEMERLRKDLEEVRLNNIELKKVNKELEDEIQEWLNAVNNK